MSGLSERLSRIVDALPLAPGMRVLEIGCGPGAAAREVARRTGPRGYVLAVDRSPKAIELLTASSAELIDEGRLGVRCVAAEELELAPGEELYDLCFAVRVGVLDGRHPQAQERTLERIAAALRPAGRLLVDGGDPLRELPLPRR